MKEPSVSLEITTLVAVEKKPRSGEKDGSSTFAKLLNDPHQNAQFKQMTLNGSKVRMFFQVIRNEYCGSYIEQGSFLLSPGRASSR